MNETIDLDVVPREERFQGIHEFPGGWSIKLYLITAAKTPFAPLQQAKELLAPMVKSITDRMSEEFVYGRFGFAIVHTGRRGVSVKITHFGTWGTTFEYFSSGWYRYGYGFNGFDLLNDIEPAFCWFEVKRTLEELTEVFDLARSRSLDAIREAYINNGLSG